MRLKLFLWYLMVASVTFLVAGCSDYNKVLKSTDMEYKYQRAVEYYNKGECYKALPLLEELIGLTRGTQRAEDVYYYFGKSQYCVKDYYLANYYFKTFSKTFSNSARAEECQFLAAYCSYMVSPNYTLDQTDTKLSIDEFQLFLDKYPNSTLRDSANKMVATLNYKLELKDVDIAKQYVKTQKYKAAVSALKEVLKNYPATKFKEELLYLIVFANYEYASGSVEDKKLERFRATNESYITFATAFPESKWLKEAETYYIRSSRQIEKLTSTASKSTE